MKKYLSLYLKYKEGILSGKWKSGEKLPGKRTTAMNENVSVVTVEKAFGMLEEEGYLSAKQKRGYFVLPLGAIKPSALKSDKKAPVLLPENDDEPKSDCRVSSWFKSIRKVIGEQGEKLMAKAPGKGCPVLRNAIAEYLFSYRSIVAMPNNIIIGSGAEQLYENVVKLLGRDKIYATENPCYKSIPKTYESEGATVISLTLGSDGIEKSQLQNSRFDVLHVTPYRSYPSFVSTSAAKRYEYLSLAHEKNLYIVEDDYASEFAFPGQPTDTLFSLDPDRVIYINTFSATISPSVRMGYMILPDSLLEEYEKKFGYVNCSVPVLEQYALADFISGGSFVRRLNRMRRKLNGKKEQADTKRNRDYR